MQRKRVLVIGLDCAPPRLVFERYRDCMPNVAQLMRAGCWGPLRSTLPPITVPAWASMLTGRDPGQLGLYGFRKRVPGSYRLALCDSTDVQVPWVWDILAKHGKHSAALFVPPSYPPQPINGERVSCLLTPGPDTDYTWPQALKSELEAKFGAYRPDIEDFRSRDPAAVLRELYAMTAQRFAIARHVWRTRAPDLLVMVDVGLDRFHHAFWHHIDPDHSRHQPGNPFEDSGRAYYTFVDAQIGKLLELADDDTAVLVVSDHGAQPLRGAVCINEWLIEQGWLALRSRPEAPRPLRTEDVDWSRTKAWGEGGYYARVCLNVRGREPNGIIPPHAYEVEIPRLQSALECLPDPGGRKAKHLVVRPTDCYREQRGLPPDLCVYFADMAWRALGTVGTGMVHARETDHGMDGCNHHRDGIFVLSGAPHAARGRIDGCQIYDVASTLLGLLDVPIPGAMTGVDWSSRRL